ncbi:MULTISPECIES: pitrilysin family protein [Rhodomicrobium]|uniref:M16 family metallopeptidase n=1 Tax=Rhodomicrobium TaxID=1068 RepID=UPI000B4C045D|nr:MULTISPECIES: pitrilysin family protein [Rhodomicrobium]
MTIEMTTLANGLRVVTCNMPHLETASLGVWVNTGARSELAREHGLAHLLEHMAFKGTPTRSALQIAEEIEAVGGAVNAMTSFETTDYFARVLREHVPLALEILGDILQNPLFAEEDMEREKEVILQEIASVQDAPDDLVFELAQEAAYPNQPLGRTILGTPGSVRALTREDLAAYRHSAYAAPRMVLGAAGAVDHDAIAAQAEALFASFPATEGRPYEPARFGGGHRSLTRRFEQSHIVIAFEAPSFRDDAYFTSLVYSVLLGGGMSSRLFQEARERRGLCYDIHAFGWGFSDSGLFGVHAATGNTQIEELVEVIMKELRAVALEGPNAPELQRAKAQLKASLLMSLESSEARAGQIARDTLVFGRQLTTAELIERIDSVSAGDVGALAASFATMKQPVTASVGPAGVSERLRGSVEDSSARETIH